MSRPLTKLLALAFLAAVGAAAAAQMPELKRYMKVRSMDD